MKIVRILPLVFSALLMAAHFLRGGNVTIVIAILCAPLLLLTRQRWATVALQIALLAAAVEWIRVAAGIAQERAAIGAPTTRMFVILGAVALFTALSAIPLRGVQPRVTLP